MSAECVRWRFGTRVLFRFVFAYLCMYGVYTLNDLMQFVGFIVLGKSFDSLLDPALHKVVPWVGKHLLHLAKDITIFSNGSGDTTYDWVLVLCELVLALTVAVVWSVLDRRRPNYRTLFAWLRQGIRLILAAEMFLYGTDKFPPLQFGDMTPSRLIVPFGRLTPFRLLWGFMAASRGYTMFGGLAEILGGLLLLIPQTVALGALVSAGVLANVFALNLFYDVPVKLFSFHLLLMALFLAAPDLPRLARMLILNRDTPAARPIPLSRRPWMNRGVPVAVSILGACLFCRMVFWAWKEHTNRQVELAARPPYYGVWMVDEFVADMAGGHPLFTDKLRDRLDLQAGEERWKSLIFERPKFLIIQCGNDALDYVKLDLAANNGQASLSDDSDPTWKGRLTMEKPSEQTLALRGEVNGAAISAKLHRMDESKFRLVSRGFHFINERPF